MKLLRVSAEIEPQDVSKHGGNAYPSESVSSTA